jgi:mycofactocin system FadH/OYE family oxidoreductase 2
MAVRYPGLFTPIDLGPLRVRNRLLQTGHTKHFARDGAETEQDRTYYVARARGGIGLIITGYRFVHPTSSVSNPGYARSYLRSAVAADRRLTDGVHEHGAAILVQLNHVGVNGSSEAPDDLRVLWGPSAVKSPVFGEVPKAMDGDDIRELVTWFGTCAELSCDGGFDGVELHVAHSFLLHQFLSPLYNKRRDEYGGPLDGRLRLTREVIAEVRRRMGPGRVLGVRLPLSDGVAGGLDVDDAVAVAGRLEADGRIDYVNLSIGGYHDGLSLAIAPSDLPDGWMLRSIGRVKAGLRRLPAFAVGGIKDAAHAERVLAERIADMVAITRADIADPDFPNKVRDGREDEVYHCIRCNQGCISRPQRGLPISCTVNPTVGRERWSVFAPAPVPRSWLVVGGGPAGMKAGELLARRGHRVTLIERETALGGQVRLILRTPGRDSFRWLVHDLEAQLRRLDVEVLLGVEATPELVLARRPDAVIVATGARPQRSGFSSVAPLVDRLSGADLPHVVTGWDVLAETAAIGRRVAVLDDDGTRYAAGVVEVLLDQGADVELVTRFPALFPSLAFTLESHFVCRRLLEKGLRVRVGTWASSIEPGRLRAYRVLDGAEETIEGLDTVVLATASEADTALFDALRGRVENLHRIGDCLAPRRLDQAIYEGFLAGCERFSTDERFVPEDHLVAATAAVAAADG